MRKKISWLILILLALPIIFNCAAKSKIIQLDAEDQFLLAKQKFEKKDYAHSIVEFQKVIFNFPGASFADSAQYLLAMSYFKDKDYVMASAEFQKVVASFPSSPLVDDATFMLAMSYYKLSPKAELDQTYTYLALEEVKGFLEYFPESEKVPEAEKLVADINDKLAKKSYQAGYFYTKQKLFGSALLYLKQVREQYPETPWSAKAKFQMAEVYLQQGKKVEAKKEFEEFLQNYPNHSWSEKAKKKLSKLETEPNPAKAEK